MPNTITWVMFTTGHGSALSVLGQWNRYLLKNSERKIQKFRWTQKAQIQNLITTTTATANQKVYQKNFRDRFILVDATVSTYAKNTHVRINHLQTMATETHCF